MSRFTPWTDEQAEQWAKEYAGKKWNFGGRETHQYYGFLDGLAKAAAQIDKCETIYYRDSDHEERVIVASPECFELDTHEAKLVGVKEVSHE